MPLTVRLLGRPAIERDGSPVPPPRGRKAWAVLAYLALAEQPVPRARLAALLFSDAADPLGALRWTLAELRRALGAPGALLGDPAAFDLPVWIDVRALEDGDPDLVRGELLEGVDPEAGAVFETWLAVTRRRLGGACEAILRAAALDELATGRPRDAAALAARSLALNPYDDALHELLVRCHARAGDAAAARRHAEACAERFARELGRRPDPAVARAAGEAEPPALGDRAAALGQLAAGRAALEAGAVQPGLECLRLACAEARALGDRAVLARALVALGSALVHALRSRDEEGAALLREGLAAAEAAGERAVAVEAARELGYVDVQAARHASAGRWLQRATALAETPAERAPVLSIRAMALSDRGHYPAAAALFGEAVELALAAGDLQWAGWACALLGRVRLLCGDLDGARATLERSLGLIERAGWVAFRPCPESALAEVLIRTGDPSAGARLAEQAFAAGCRLGDPCWEALAARALALGDADPIPRLRDAVARMGRVTDPYVWIRAFCLDALAGAAIAAGEPDAPALVAELERIAAHGDLRELSVRAAAHRAALGDPSALEAARLLAEAIDNPRLHAELHTPAHTAAR
jgi:DNA-binding SARP family transcriptional activator